MSALSVSSEVADALAAGRPVVALESTIISHGLPRPRNHAAALEFEQILRDRGVTPATVAVLDGIPRVGLDAEGVRRIAVVMPGFSADCLETLEEIAGENSEIFKHNGGEQFAAIPCLNDSDGGMDVISKLVLRELQGWI